MSLSWLPLTEMEKISLLKKQFCQIKIPAFLHIAIDLYQLIATIKQTESDHQPCIKHSQTIKTFSDIDYQQNNHPHEVIKNTNITKNL